MTMSQNQGLDSLLLQDFFSGREIFMEEEFTDESVNEVARQLLMLQRVADQNVGKFAKLEDGTFAKVALTYDDFEVNLHVSSYGGSVHECFRLMDIINSCKFRVNTIGYGKCMSAGAFLLLSGTGTRSAYENCSIMLHGIQSVSHGDVAEVENDFMETKRMQAVLKKMVGDRCGLDKKQVEALFAKDNYLTAVQAKKLGVIDEIVKRVHRISPPRKSKAKAKAAAE
jgi:ATP-dependent Clp endopeptidase proteolytic subunit ClpP